MGYFILVYLAAMEGEDITEKYISGAHTEDKPENTEHFQDPLIEHNEDINSTMSSTSISSRLWKIFGKTIPKNEVIFICQVVILYIVIITCIVNLSLGNGDSNLWTALLSSSMGIMLPAPTLSRRRSWWVNPRAYEFHSCPMIGPSSHHLCDVDLMCPKVAQRYRWLDTTHDAIPCMVGFSEGNVLYLV